MSDATDRLKALNNATQEPAKLFLVGDEQLTADQLETAKGDASFAYSEAERKLLRNASQGADVRGLRKALNEADTRRRELDAAKPAKRSWRVQLADRVAFYDDAQLERARAEAKKEAEADAKPKRKTMVKPAVGSGKNSE